MLFLHGSLHSGRHRSRRHRDGSGHRLPRCTRGRGVGEGGGRGHRGGSGYAGAVVDLRFCAESRGLRNNKGRLGDVSDAPE